MSNKNKINLFFRLSLESCEDENDFIYEDLGVSKEEYLNNKIKMINKLSKKRQIEILEDTKKK